MLATLRRAWEGVEWSRWVKRYGDAISDFVDGPHCPYIKQKLNSNPAKYLLSIRS